MTTIYQRGDIIIGGAALSSYDRSDSGSLRAARRVRRFGRISRQRLSLWLLLIGALFFMYMTFFSLKVHFHGQTKDGIPSFSGIQRRVEEKAHISETKDGTSSFSGQQEKVRIGETDDVASFFSGIQERAQESARDINITKRKKSRKHYPCDIEFAKSAEYILEPKVYLNVTNFALEYIDKEERPLIKSPDDLRFGGHQSLEERERSFYARNQTLHCGFVKGPDGIGSTGFDLTEKDKKYMSSCVIVVSSCIFGSSDFLRRPTSRLISEYSKKNVCFVMFLDEETLLKLSSEGNTPDDKGHMGLWRIVVVKNLPYEDMRRTGKVPKLLAHRLFPSSSYSIWLDSKMRLNADPLLILERFLWRKRSEFAISKHYDRRCVWEEVLQNKRLNKYNHTAIDEQFMFYQSDGLTKFDASDPDKPLPSNVPEGSFIIRAHTPMSNLFNCLWFNEVDRFTSRDQLSFAYTYLKLKRTNPDKPFFLNMFEDCERRALVKLFRHREIPSPPAPP